MSCFVLQEQQIEGRVIMELSKLLAFDEPTGNCSYLPKQQVQASGILGLKVQSGVMSIR
jgi:hypothetical protein